MRNQLNSTAMIRFFRELFFWALSVVFAGIMLVGFCAEISIGTMVWAEGLVKVLLSSFGFVGCYWAANKTSFGHRISGHSFE